PRAREDLADPDVTAGHQIRVQVVDDDEQDGDRAQPLHLGTEPMTGPVGAGRVHRAGGRGTRRKQRERWSHRVIVSPPRVRAKATRANTSVFSPNAHPTGVGTHHTFPRTNTENTAPPLRNSDRLLWYAPVRTPVLHDLGSLPDPGPARSVPPPRAFAP